MHSATPSGRQYHIACEKGDLARYVLVPGDPERVPKIAGLWDSGKEIAHHRGFRSFTGVYGGVPISALSSGIGPASMAIAVNEAANLGVDTFIRVGSTGAIQRKINCGDLIISSAAVRLDCTSNCYIMPEYPAVANYEVLLALIEAAEMLSLRYHVGITATTADFYAEQSRNTRASCASWARNLLPVLQKARVLNFEMEAATLLTLASLFGLRAGVVCAVFNNRVRGDFEPGAGEEDAIRVANQAIKILNEWDAAKRKGKKRWLVPSTMTLKRS
jgi:uridine phosphorylase